MTPEERARALFDAGMNRMLRTATYPAPTSEEIASAIRAAENEARLRTVWLIRTDTEWPLIQVYATKEAARRFLGLHATERWGDPVEYDIEGRS